MRVPQRSFACICVLLVQLSLRADDESMRRFLTEAPAAWQEAKRFNHGKKFLRKSTSQQKFNGLDIALSQRDYSVHWCGDSARIEGVLNTDKADGSAKTITEAMSARVKNTVDYAAILNPDYLARLGVKPKAKLSLIVSADSAEFLRARNEILSDAFPGLTLRDTFMPLAIIDLPGFVNCELSFGYRIKDVERRSDDANQEVMRVSLEAHSFGGNILSDAFRKGFRAHVDLLPGQNWVVQAFHQEYAYEDGSGKFVVDQSCKYDGSSPHPKYVHLKEASNRKNNQTEATATETTLSPLTDSTYTKTDCLLSAFGLPEPKPPSSRSLYSWAAMLIAVIATSVMIFSRWKKRGST